MGNVSTTRKRGLAKEHEKYCKPTGLYDTCPWEERVVKRWIYEGHVAPRFPGRDVPGLGQGGGKGAGSGELEQEGQAIATEECPICFMHYQGVNKTMCCAKPLCTECYLQVRPPRMSVVCPFCNSRKFSVKYQGPISKEEIQERMAEEQHTIEAKIRAEQEELYRQAKEKTKRDIDMKAAENKPTGVNINGTGGMPSSSREEGIGAGSSGAGNASIAAGGGLRTGGGSGIGSGSVGGSSLDSGGLFSLSSSGSNFSQPELSRDWSVPLATVAGRRQLEEDLRRQRLPHAGLGRQASERARVGGGGRGGGLDGSLGMSGPISSSYPRIRQRVRPVRPPHQRTLSAEVDGGSSGDLEGLNERMQGGVEGGEDRMDSNTDIQHVEDIMLMEALRLSVLEHQLWRERSGDELRRQIEAAEAGGSSALEGQIPGEANMLLNGLQPMREAANVSHLNDSVASSRATLGARLAAPYNSTYVELAPTWSQRGGGGVGQNPEWGSHLRPTVTHYSSHQHNVRHQNQGGRASDGEAETELAEGIRPRILSAGVENSGRIWNGGRDVSAMGRGRELSSLGLMAGSGSGSEESGVGEGSSEGGVTDRGVRLGQLQRSGFGGGAHDNNQPGRQHLWESGVSNVLSGAAGGMRGRGGGMAEVESSGGETCAQVMLGGMPMEVPDSEEEQMMLAIELSLRTATAEAEAEGAASKATAGGNVLGAGEVGVATCAVAAPAPAPAPALALAPAPALASALAPAPAPAGFGAKARTQRTVEGKEKEVSEDNVEGVEGIEKTELLAWFHDVREEAIAKSLLPNPSAQGQPPINPLARPTPVQDLVPALGPSEALSSDGDECKLSPFSSDSSISHSPFPRSISETAGAPPPSSLGVTFEGSSRGIVDSKNATGGASWSDAVAEGIGGLEGGVSGRGGGAKGIEKGLNGEDILVGKKMPGNWASGEEDWAKSVGVMGRDATLSDVGQGEGEEESGGAWKMGTDEVAPAGDDDGTVDELPLVMGGIEVGKGVHSGGGGDGTLLERGGSQEGEGGNEALLERGGSQEGEGGNETLLEREGSQEGEGGNETEDVDEEEKRDEVQDGEDAYAGVLPPRIREIFVPHGTEGSVLFEAGRAMPSDSVSREEGVAAVACEGQVAGDTLSEGSILSDTSTSSDDHTSSLNSNTSSSTLLDGRTRRVLCRLMRKGVSHSGELHG